MIAPIDELLSATPPPLTVAICTDADARAYKIEYPLNASVATKSGKVREKADVPLIDAITDAAICLSSSPLIPDGARRQPVVVDSFVGDALS
jgi:hypothetical protein